jgi:hypothetical protein
MRRLFCAIACLAVLGCTRQDEQLVKGVFDVTRAVIWCISQAAGPPTTSNDYRAFAKIPVVRQGSKAVHLHTRDEIARSIQALAEVAGLDDDAAIGARLQLDRSYACGFDAEELGAFGHRRYYLIASDALLCIERPTRYGQVRQVLILTGVVVDAALLAGGGTDATTTGRE